jgi:hypothetical protein
VVWGLGLKTAFPDFFNMACFKDALVASYL